MPQLDTIFDDLFLDSLVVLGQNIDQADPVMTDPWKKQELLVPGETLPVTSPTEQTAQQPKQIQLMDSDYALATKLVSSLSLHWQQAKQQTQSNQLGQATTQQASTFEWPFSPITGTVSMNRIWEFAVWMSKKAESNAFGVKTEVVREYVSTLQGVVADYHENTNGHDGFVFDTETDESDMVQSFLAFNTGRRHTENMRGRKDFTIYQRAINAASYAAQAAATAIGLLSMLKAGETERDRADIDAQIAYGRKLKQSLGDVVIRIRSMMQNAGR
jgi:hypothetical protein